jgi:hypothetical protein
VLCAYCNQPNARIELPRGVHTPRRGKYCCDTCWPHAQCRLHRFPQSYYQGQGLACEHCIQQVARCITQVHSSAQVKEAVCERLPYNDWQLVYSVATAEGYGKAENGLPRLLAIAIIARQQSYRQLLRSLGKRGLIVLLGTSVAQYRL